MKGKSEKIGKFVKLANFGYLYTMKNATFFIKKIVEPQHFFQILTYLRIFLIFTQSVVKKIELRTDRKLRKEEEFVLFAVLKFPECLLLTPSS